MLFEFFSPIWSHVHQNEKNPKRKNKILKKKKNILEMLWTGTFPQNLALIHLTIAEKISLTDGRRTDAHKLCANNI